MSTRWPGFGGIGMIALAVAWFTATPAVAQPGTDAPYVPTPDDVVDRMLELAEVTPSDVVYDLGCGDGRIVIAAARRYGARGVGIDIDTALLDSARARAREAGVDHLVSFVEQDLFETDLSAATVVTLYLLPALNMQLRPALIEQLPTGARVVSHNFDMEDWVPDAVDTFVDGGGVDRRLFLWRLGAPGQRAPGGGDDR